MGLALKAVLPPALFCVFSDYGCNQGKMFCMPPGRREMSVLAKKGFLRNLSMPGSALDSMNED